MAYTTETRVRRRLGNVVSGDVSSTAITDAIEKADAIIDAYLSSLYVVPITGTTPALVQHLSEELAVYFVGVDMFPSGNVAQDIDTLDERYKKAIKMLEMIKNGKLSVPGATDIASSSSQIWNSAKSYKRFFDVDHEIFWGQDSDLLDDVADDRDDADSKLPHEDL